jgi:hypothetical protein
MRHRHHVAVLFTLALALAVGSLMASNMGFLVWRTLIAPTPDISRSGQNTLGLPYQSDPDLTTAGSLMTDIGFASVGAVQRWVLATSTLQVYTGRKGSPSPNFPLATGECYFVRMNTTTDYLVGGSADPGFVLALAGPGPGNPGGVNFVVLPYHHTAQTASQLIDDIGLASVSNVQRFLAATEGFQVYTGRKGSPGADFPIAPTECYFVSMVAPVAYVPTHY